METAWEFTYLGNRVSAGGGYEAAVTAKTRCRWVKFRECGVLLYGRFPLKLKGVVCRIYLLWPAIQYGSEAWCLKENEMGFYEGQRYPWLEQCVEYSSKIENDLQIFVCFYIFFYERAMSSPEK